MHVPRSNDLNLFHIAIGSFQFDVSHHPPPPPRCIRSMISERPSYVSAWIASLIELRKVPLILSQLGDPLVALVEDSIVSASGWPSDAKSSLDNARVTTPVNTVCLLRGTGSILGLTFFFHLPSSPCTSDCLFPFMCHSHQMSCSCRLIPAFTPFASPYYGPSA